ncbi:FUSC family membrane protein [Halopseudomonas sp. SMJS2]|uniref:FUSC family protein n=1 Tax=Halopseudomonas sp. SMJS2 TaxID=3041098 RepID=UPI0024529FB9|nr:FUSC family membrane protein [Halopseudomonas sp. SMJS2]WGK60185.1 FUSC family membrane protein [Halopseudomonas sp. SMJS2]
MARRLGNALRVLLSSYVTTGISAGVGLLLVSAGVYLLFGRFPASVAAVGAIICIPPDHALPRRGKLRSLLPAALLGLPLFVSVQALHDQPLYLGLLLVPATFIAFLAGAWGQRGVPIVISIMLAMIFSMAIPQHLNTGSLMNTALYFAMGSACYVLYATASNALLNGRYRVQLLAQSMLTLSQLMRTQADCFDPTTDTPSTGQLMQQQAALADQLQSARDLLLESPRTTRRQRLAAMLINVLEMRDHLLASELDLDLIKSRPDSAEALTAMRKVIDQLADEVDRMADALLRGRKPAPLTDLRPALAALNRIQAESSGQPGDTPSLRTLLRGLTNRVGNINDEILRLNRLARGDVEPDLAAVRTAWQLFVSPTNWSLRPILVLWRWDAPPMRHAIRAALAIGTGYLLSLALPWATHGYWILVTIVVVLRGSLSQTLERRNSRVAGTILGCVLAGAILSTQAPTLLLLVIVPIAQAVSHSFAIKRYLITAVAATVVSLVQAHLLSGVDIPVFNALERIADTLIGVGIAWAFSYVLPSWERSQIPSLVNRTLLAQARHAQVALNLGHLTAVDNEPELEWRLARKEAYDSLSALVQATRRSIAEPRAVRPRLESLESLLGHGYQLLAQLTTVKTMLLMRRHQEQEDVQDALRVAAAKIGSTLTAAQAPEPSIPLSVGGWEQEGTYSDPFVYDLKPWILRRLDLACGIAERITADANTALQPAGEPERSPDRQ